MSPRVTVCRGLAPRGRRQRQRARRADTRSPSLVLRRRANPSGAKSTDAPASSVSGKGSLVGIDRYRRLSPTGTRYPLAPEPLTEIGQNMRSPADLRKHDGTAVRTRSPIRAPPTELEPRCVIGVTSPRHEAAGAMAKGVQRMRPLYRRLRGWFRLITWRIRRDRDLRKQRSEDRNTYPLW